MSGPLKSSIVFRSKRGYRLIFGTYSTPVSRFTESSGLPVTVGGWGWGRQDQSGCKPQKKRTSDVIPDYIRLLPAETNRSSLIHQTSTLLNVCGVVIAKSGTGVVAR